jgi:methionyl-tRNA formyltransferase
MYDHSKVVTASDITEADYRFVEKNAEETSYVQLTGDTPWKGTVFQYGNLRVLVPETDNVENATLSFSYNIIDTPLREEVLQVDKAFKNYLGAVLEHLLTDAFETGEYKLGSNDSDNDPEEPTT